MEENKKNKTVIRIYGSYCDYLNDLWRHDYFLPDGVGLELCAIDRDEGKITYRCAKKETGRLFVEGHEEGWANLDPDVQYNLLVDAWWPEVRNNKMRGIKGVGDAFIPTELLGIMRQPNIIDIGFCNDIEHTACENAVEGLKGHLPNVYDFGHYFGGRDELLNAIYRRCSKDDNKLPKFTRKAKSEREPKIIDTNSDMIAYIESMMRTYCPIMEKRCESFWLPSYKIGIINKDGMSQIIFYEGEGNKATVTADKAIVTHISSFDEIDSIVAYLFDDHDKIANIENGEKGFSIIFKINKESEKANRGLSCSNIELSVEFENEKEKNECLEKIIRKYYKFLEKEPFFEQWLSTYYNLFMKKIYGEIDKAGLLALIEKLDEDEIREMLMGMGYKTFLGLNLQGQELDIKRLLRMNQTGNGNNKK